MGDNDDGHGGPGVNMSLIRGVRDAFGDVDRVTREIGADWLTDSFQRCVYERASRLCTRIKGVLWHTREFYTRGQWG
jgi:hypothetical protein